MEPAATAEGTADDANKVERAVGDPQSRRSSASPILRRPRRAASPASVSQLPLRALQPSRLATADNAVKRGRGRPQKRPAPPEDDISVLPIHHQPSADSAPCPLAPAVDPRWQPWIPLRRVDDPRPPTPEDIARVNSRLRKLAL